MRVMHKVNQFSLVGKEIPINSYDRVSILFTYFEVLQSLLSVFDNMEYTNKYITIPYKVVIIGLVLFLNYLFIVYKAFMKVFVFIILINDSRRKIKSDIKSDIVISIKRWYN